MGGDGFQVQKWKRYTAAAGRREELVAKALIDGRKEWVCKQYSETNVWTRAKCRRCSIAIPVELQEKNTSKR